MLIFGAFYSLKNPDFFFLTVLNIDDDNNNNNNKMFLEQKNLHIRMISEGSCDIEHWSNDSGNVALITASGIN